MELGGLGVASAGVSNFMPAMGTGCWASEMSGAEDVQKTNWMDRFIMFHPLALLLYPLVHIQKAMENDHRNSGFTY